MLYSRYRKYPFPRDAKEAGRGGLHSQLLAEAVARDLDVVDAAWATELARPTMMVTLSSDVTGVVANLVAGAIVTSPWALEKQTGPTIFTSTNTWKPLTGQGGWFHVSLTMRTKASGTINTDAVHRVGLEVIRLNAAGYYAREYARWTQSFQSGSADMYNEVQGMFYLDDQRIIRPHFLHNNSGSTCTIVGSGTGGTRVTLTRILGE